MSIPSGSVVGSGEVPSVLGRLVPVPLWSKSFSYFKKKKMGWGKRDFPSDSIDRIWYDTYEIDEIDIQKFLLRTY
jgi:hypothetical protein